MIPEPPPLYTRCMRLWFGKYRDVPLEKVPEDYLLWLLDNCHDLSPTLREAIRFKLFGCIRAPNVPPFVVKGLVDSLFLWHRALRRDYDPQKGRSPDALKAIDDGYDRLKRRLENALARYTKQHLCRERNGRAAGYTD